MFSKLLDAKKPLVGKVKFIAIDGRGGSGKSTVARLLATELAAEIIQTDDFASHENPLNNWWPLVIERVFQPIAKGAVSLSYPRSKWWPAHNPEPVEHQTVTRTMILEGVSALRREFRPYISVGVFVDTPREVCLQRGIARDLANDTGKTKAEITRMWNEWAAAEDEYLRRDNPEEIADIVIDGTRPLEKADGLRHGSKNEAK